MAKIIKKTGLKKDNSLHEERLMVLVENLGDEIKLVAEGNLMLRETMESNFKKVWDKFDSLEGDMRSGFKMIVEHLSRIEDEIAEIKIDFERLEEKKADKDALAILEKRIAKIDRELEEYKNFCKK